MTRLAVAIGVSIGLFAVPSAAHAATKFEITYSPERRAAIPLYAQIAVKGYASRSRPKRGTLQLQQRAGRAWKTVDSTEIDSDSSRNRLLLVPAVGAPAIRVRARIVQRGRAVAESSARRFILQPHRRLQCVEMYRETIRPSFRTGGRTVLLDGQLASRGGRQLVAFYEAHGKSCVETPPTRDDFGRDSLVNLVSFYRWVAFAALDANQSARARSIATTALAVIAKLPLTPAERDTGNVAIVDLGLISQGKYPGQSSGGGGGRGGGRGGR